MDWNVRAAQWIRQICLFQSPQTPQQVRSLADEGNVQFPQERKWPLTACKQWLRCQRITYHLVCDGSTVSSGWRKEACQLQRKRAGNKPAKQLCQLLTGAQEPWSHCTARDLLPWLSYWSSQLTSGFARRMAVGEEGFCSKHKWGEQSVCNSLDSEWADTQTY